ncbi:MAG: hypothetical protein MHM6MM_000008 [Cercozoa sp. M6MM]
MLLVLSVDQELSRSLEHTHFGDLQLLVDSVRGRVASNDDGGATHVTLLGDSDTISRMCAKVSGCSVDYIQVEAEIHRVCKLTQLLENRARFYKHVVLVLHNLSVAKAFEPALQSVRACGVELLDAITLKPVAFPAFRRIIELKDLVTERRSLLLNDGVTYPPLSAPAESSLSPGLFPPQPGLAFTTTTRGQEMSSPARLSLESAQLRFDSSATQLQSQYTSPFAFPYPGQQQQQQQEPYSHENYKYQQQPSCHQQQQQHDHSSVRNRFSFFSGETHAQTKQAHLPPRIQYKSLWAVRIKVAVSVPNSRIRGAMSSCGRVVYFHAADAHAGNKGQREIRVIFTCREFAQRAKERFDCKMWLSSYAMPSPMVVTTELVPHYRMLNSLERKFYPKEAWLTVIPAAPALQNNITMQVRSESTSATTSRSASIESETTASSAVSLPRGTQPGQVSSLLSEAQVRTLRRASNQPTQRECLPRAVKILLDPNPAHYMETEGADGLDQEALELLSSVDAIEQRSRRWNTLAWLNLLLSSSYIFEDANSIKLLHVSGSKTRVMMNTLCETLYYVHFRSAGEELEPTNYRASEDEVCDVLQQLGRARNSPNCHAKHFDTFSKFVQNWSIKPEDVVEYAKLIRLVDCETNGSLKLSAVADDVMKMFSIVLAPANLANSCACIDAFLMKESSR